MAFAGVFDASSSRDNIRDGSYGEGLSDILTETNDDRQINEITAVLGQVANMTWLGESLLNVTEADEANRVTDMENTVDIAVESSGVSGTVVWSGDEAFNGDPISETTFILRNIWSMTDNYTVETTSGSFTSDESRILQERVKPPSLRTVRLTAKALPLPATSSEPSPVTLATIVRSLPTVPGPETVSSKHRGLNPAMLSIAMLITNRTPSCR